MASAVEVSSWFGGSAQAVKSGSLQDEEVVQNIWSVMTNEGDYYEPTIQGELEQWMRESRIDVDYHALRSVDPQ